MNIYLKFLEYLEQEGKTTPENQIGSSVKIVFSYKEESKKREVQDFVSYFNARYTAIEKILRNRQELQNISSINKNTNKKSREEVALIGMIKDKKTTSNNNIVLEIEDPTSSIKVLVSKDKKELFDTASNLVLDEVIGLVGVSGDKIVFANNILLPDIPANKEQKKSPDRAYSIFLSDLHVGSDKFLENEFTQFLDWINGKTGSDEQKEIAQKTK